MNPEIITPNEIQALLNRAPVKPELMDSHKYADANRLQLVTSPNIFAPNSTKFHPQGLFSEEIFGSITSMERYTTEAAIALNTLIIHPMIFATNIQPKSLYMSILAGRQYAIFDETVNDFILANKDEDSANTGFQFFVSHLKYLTMTSSSGSLKTDNKNKLLIKYKDKLLASHIICLPAGLRDLDLKSARLSNDDINKLYMAVINLASSLSHYTLSEDIIFDGLRYQLQLKVAAVHDYVMDILSGKGGFLQKHYGARKIAFSTRNVISVPVNDADTPEDPGTIKADETMVSMLNLIKCFQPFFTFYVKRKLYGEIFVHGSTEKVAVTDPKTLEMQYVNLKSSEINRYTTSEGVNKIINQFKHVGFRESPISITDDTGKVFWLLLTYTIGDTVYISKSSSDLKQIIENDGHSFDKKEIKAMTWIEFMYIIGLQITKKRRGFLTRHPVLGDGSIYPSKLHPITTDPSRQMKIKFDTGLTMDVPHYPILGKPYYESLMVHPSRLAGLGGDFDGDVLSLSTLYSKESNDDIDRNIDSISAVIDPSMRLKLSTDSDIVNLAIFNLSRQDILV